MITLYTDSNRSFSKGNGLNRRVVSINKNEYGFEVNLL